MFYQYFCKIFNDLSTATILIMVTISINSIAHAASNNCITPAVTIATITSTPNSWFRITGSISLYGNPLCSLVLANGQYMFTCGDSLPKGNFDLTVPPDDQGQITLFGFSSGLPPFELTFFSSLRREAEDTPTGIGGIKLSRTNSSGGAVWHLNNIGDKANYVIRLPDGAGNYKLLVRYSNDDTGIGDDIRVCVNNCINNNDYSFHTQNTRSPGVNLGDGWDLFVNTPVIHLKNLPADSVVTFELVSTDGFGVDLDLFSLAPEF